MSLIGTWSVPTSTQSGGDSGFPWGPMVGALGLSLGIYGAFTGATGASNAARQRQYELRAQALGYELSAKLAEMNARLVELQARYIVQAHRREAMVVGIKSGQAEGTARATMAARGVDLGVGSPAEVMATSDIMREIDLLTINTNMARDVAAKRMDAASYRAQGLMDSLSGRNLRGSAGLIDPGQAYRTSLLGSAGQMASWWAPLMMSAGR